MFFNRIVICNNLTSYDQDQSVLNEMLLGYKIVENFITKGTWSITITIMHNQKLLRESKH